MLSNFHACFRNPLVRNVIFKLNKFSYKEHLKHDLTQPKAYRRILPSAKKLITEHSISEDHLPDFRIIKKEHILEIIKRLKVEKSKVRSIIQAPIEKQQTTPILSLSPTPVPAHTPIPAPTPIPATTPTLVAPNKKVVPSAPKVNVFDEISTKKEIDYLSFKNKFPHTYFYQTANVEKLITFLDELNSNNNKNIKLEDFLVKAVSKLINKNDNLKILFDNNSNKFINYKSSKDVDVYLKNYRKEGKNYTEEQFAYLNPHNLVTPDIAKCKKILSEFKEKFTPFIRVFNYSEMDVLNIDEIIVPPALLSLSIGKVYQKIIEAEGKISHARHLNLTLTGVATIFQEDSLTVLLEDLARYIENPLNISL